MSARVLIVATKSVDVVSRVRTKCGNQGRVYRIVLLPEVVQGSAERVDVVENDAVGYKVIVFDGLALLVTVIGRNSPITAKG